MVMILFPSQAIEMGMFNEYYHYVFANLVGIFEKI